MSLRRFLEEGRLEGRSPTDEYDEGLECRDPSLARQSEAKDADINVILARYEKTGVLPVAQREALFVDVSEVGDYRELVERVRGTERVFAQLPAAVRARFGNEPAAFIDFMSDPRNLAEARKIGLVEPEKAPVEAKPKDAQ